MVDYLVDPFVAGTSGGDPESLSVRDIFIPLERTSRIRPLLLLLALSVIKRPILNKVSINTLGSN